MTYTIKCIAGIHSTEDFSIRGGQELEVSKKIYDYFNNRFGSSGNFIFSALETAPKKAVAKKVETRVDEVKEEVEVKVEKKTVKSSK